MRYYTQMPTDTQFNKLKQLSQNLTQNKTTVIDKVLAVRDHFLQLTPSGKPVFKYSDNPGVPGIPSAKKLIHFLLESHNGYCAYYAGATLFMLRSCGIPARLSTGFLTVDRSDKNKGWYWFYADQAHAWVQVYFPEYGWIDFDTTVGDEDAQQSPQADGTPPMQPPKPYLTVRGLAQNIDTLSKQINLKPLQILVQDVSLSTPSTTQNLNMDCSIAKFYKDTIEISISAIKTTDTILAVCYSETLKNIKVLPNQNWESIKNQYPATIPTDEVYIKTNEPPKQENTTLKNAVKKPFNYANIFWAFLGIVLLILSTLFLLPLIVLAKFKRKIKNTNAHTNLNYQYLATLYLSNQCGYPIKSKTPIQFAKQDIDPRFKTQATAFMQQYVHLKYAPQNSNNIISHGSNQFFSTFQKQFLGTFTATQKIKYFTNFLDTLQFLNQYKPFKK
jgi:hypothetical protein